MNYHFLPKDRDKAYITNNLMLPKCGLRTLEAPTKRALTFVYGETEVRDELGELIMVRPAELLLWQETQHHLIVPREFLNPRQYPQFGFEFIDQRPVDFPFVEIEDRADFRDESQRNAFRAMEENHSGTVNLACGKGKTFLALKLAACLQVPTMIVVNSTALLEQWKLEIEKFLGVGRVGVIQGPIADWEHPIVLAMVHTLSKHRESWSMRFRKRFGLAIYDECFPANTLVGNIPIQEIHPGDLVSSYDQTSHRLLDKKVVKVFKNPVLSLVKITAGGKSVVCTPNHPFLTKNGWAKAGNLTSDDMVYSTTKTYKPKRDGEHDYSQNSKHQMQRVWDPGAKIGEGWTRTSETKSGVLLPTVRGNSSFSRKLEKNGTNQPKIRVGENEKEQSHETGRGTSEGEYNFTSNGMDPHGTGRKRKVSADSSAVASVRLGVANGSVCGDTKPQDKQQCQSLQTGHRKSGIESRNRGRREFPFRIDKERTGPKKGENPNWVRVDNIEILEPGSDGTFGGLCPDGFVYNLEVEDTHTYFANGFVVHNCHHIAAPTFVKSADLFFGKRIALTATATRIDGLEAIYQYHLGSVIHKNLEQDLIPTTYFHRLKWEFDLRNKPLVTDSNGDFNFPRIRTYLGELDWRNQIIYRDLLSDLQEGRQILVLSHSVEHVDRLQQCFWGSGHRAGTITGETPQEERMGVLRQCNPVIGTFQLAREGLNKPSLDTLYVTTPFSSPNDLQQAWGRIQRVLPGKQPSLVRVYEDLPFKMCRGSCSSLRSHLRKIDYPSHKLEVEIPNEQVQQHGRNNIQTR